MLLVREAASDNVSRVDAARRRAAAQARAADLAAELRESREQLAAVNEVLSAVGRSAGDPDMVLTTIVEQCPAAVSCRCRAALPARRRPRLPADQGGRHQRPVDRLHRRAPPAAGPRHPDGPGEPGPPAQQIEDVLADPEYGRLDLQRVAGFRTTMGAPMLVDDEVVGVLVVWRDDRQPVRRARMIIVTAFAAQAALAITEGRAGAGARRPVRPSWPVGSTSSRRSPRWVRRSAPASTSTRS